MDDKEMTIEQILSEKHGSPVISFEMLMILKSSLHISKDILSLGIMGAENNMVQFPVDFVDSLHCDLNTVLDIISNYESLKIYCDELRDKNEELEGKIWTMKRKNL